MIRENKNDIDCIEIHNGRNVSMDFSARQLEIAQRYNIRQVIGSDAHTLIEVGRNYMNIRNIPSCREDFIREIKDAEFVTVKCVSISHKITIFVKLFKLVLGGKFFEIYKIFIQKISQSIKFNVN